jgi:para-aminobenzoate synthetase component 1
MANECENWVEQMNALGSKKEAFLFVLDFELKKPFICKISDLQDNIFYNFPLYKKMAPFTLPEDSLQFAFTPVSREVFDKAFQLVISEQKKGNSYLTNLTFPSLVDTNYSLQSLYQVAKAKYKLYFKGEFIVFSPESFVTIREGCIRTFPMKGTINASLANAEQQIMDDAKEKAEHNTIVDLMRNDLSTVAKNVTVNRFRYIDRIKSRQSELLQVSSEISGQLPAEYFSRLGDLFAGLLPAGSISGAPKKKTVGIIREAEVGPRGYYTGVCGIFDGENLDSAVMIRFIEKQGDQLLYRSGGGITAMSNPEAEYTELTEKIYVPVG